jgi:mono/diheme cytochrome c family protein
MQMKNTPPLLLSLIAVIICLHVSGQKWEVPEAKQKKVSPFLFKEDVVREGEGIYTRLCVSCHGNPGQNNALKTLNPVPPDLAADQVQQDSDGELLFKITEGRGIMPGFKNVISDRDRWKVIGFLRSFNKKYIQPAPDTTADMSEKVRITLVYDSAASVVKIVAKAAAGKDSVLLSGAQTLLFVKRYFGNLPLDSMRMTDATGSASFRIPHDLHADTAGMIKLIVSLNDEKYGEAFYEQGIKAGIRNTAPALNEQRAMWNIVVKAPWWIIIMYSVVVLGIWAFLFYIIAGLLKIKKAGKNTI